MIHIDTVEVSHQKIKPLKINNTIFLNIGSETSCVEVGLTLVNNLIVELRNPYIETTEPQNDVG
jgi:hypothetical protein